MTKISKTEAEVLRVYKEVSPSYYEIENKSELEKTKHRITNLFLNRLKFPLQMFNDSEVLDIGCGTGEHSLILAMHGASINGVEMNSISVERIKNVFKQNNLAHKLSNVFHGSLFDYDSPEKIFDITMSLGVIHHTEDPELAFKKQVQFLKPAGFTILGIANPFGQFQRNLQRYMVFRLCDGDESRYKETAYSLFKQHLDRAVKYGRRTLDSIVYDQFVNPKIKTFNTKTILRWFKENNLKLYSSWPRISPPFLSDSGYIASEKMDSIFLEDSSILNELFWMTKNHNDEDEWEEQILEYQKLHEALDVISTDLNDVNQANYTKKLYAEIDSSKISGHLNNIFGSMQQKGAMISEFLEEVDLCLSVTNALDLDRLQKTLKGFKHLFQGNCGVGMNFFVGYKDI